MHGLLLLFLHAHTEVDLFQPWTIALFATGGVLVLLLMTALTAVPTTIIVCKSKLPNRYINLQQIISKATIIILINHNKNTVMCLLYMLQKIQFLQNYMHDLLKHQRTKQALASLSNLHLMFKKRLHMCTTVFTSMSMLAQTLLTVMTLHMRYHYISYYNKLMIDVHINCNL